MGRLSSVVLSVCSLILLKKQKDLLSSKNGKRRKNNKTIGAETSKDASRTSRLELKDEEKISRVPVQELPSFISVKRHFSQATLRLFFLSAICNFFLTVVDSFSCFPNRIFNHFVVFLLF